MRVKSAIALVMLVVLSGLPVSGAICAVRCESAPGIHATAGEPQAATSASHHHHGHHMAMAATSSVAMDDADGGAGLQPGKDTVRPPDATHVQSVAEHDCSDHDGTLRDPSTAAAGRQDWSLASSTHEADGVAAAVIPARARTPRIDPSPPPAPPSTAIPLVLRV